MLCSLTLTNDTCAWTPNKVMYIYVTVRLIRVSRAEARKIQAKTIFYPNMLFSICLCFSSFALIVCVWSLCVWYNKRLSEFEKKETCAGPHMCDNTWKYIISLMKKRCHLDLSSAAQKIFQRGAYVIKTGLISCGISIVTVFARIWESFHICPNQAPA